MNLMNSDKENSTWKNGYKMAAIVGAPWGMMFDNEPT